MNYLPTFISPELAQALGWTILHSLWQGALVAVTLAVLLILLHRHAAKVRYSVATVALLAVPALATLTFWRTYPAPPSATAPTYLPTTQTASTITALVPPAPVAASAVTGPAAPKPKEIVFPQFQDYFGKHLPVVVLGWLLGTLVMLLRFLGGLAYVQRLKHTQLHPLGRNWHARLQDLAQRLLVSRPVQLAESALVKTPLVIGYLKPIILLPVGTVAGLSAEQVEAVLAHELAHIHRKDFLLNIGQALVEILFFFNPAVWWISDYVRVERENCCDDQALALCGNPLTYARALTQLETIAVSAPRLTLAFAGKDGSLLGRIKRLVQPHRPPSFAEGFGAACVLLVGVTALSVSAVAGFRVTNEATIVNPVKYTPVVVNQEKEVAPAEVDHAQAASYAVIDSTGRKNDLIIIKNKKGAITELYVNGRKIPRQNIPEFQTLIDQSLTNAAKAPRLPATDKAAALAEVAQSLRELEQDQSFNFAFDSNFAKLNEVQRELLENFKNQPDWQQMQQQLDDQREGQQELLKKFKDQKSNFNFDSNFFRLAVPPLPAMPVLPPLPDLPATPPFPALPSMPPVSLLPSPLFSIKSPLEYLRSEAVTEKTLLVIDGKKARKTKEQNPLAGLTNENIRGINVLSQKKATQKYGNAGKDGAVEVTTGPGRGYFFNAEPDSNLMALQRNLATVQRRQEKEHTRLMAEHQVRMQEQKVRMKELQAQAAVRHREHAARLKENQARLKEHAARLEEHQIRVQEHAKRTQEHAAHTDRLAEIKQELVKDKLIDANAKTLSVMINQDGFTLNGVKQPAIVFEKYKKLFFPDRTDWSGSFSHTIKITED